MSLAINEKRISNLRKVVLMGYVRCESGGGMKMNKHSITYPYSMSHREGIRHSSVESHMWPISGGKAEM